LVTLRCFHEADIAFLDEVKQCEAVADVALRDIHDEAEIPAYEFLFHFFKQVAVGLWRRRGQKN
jgi:hypothetical protein